MKIDDNLALSFDVGNCKAHSTPISRPVFEANFKIISATKATLYATNAKAAFTVSPMIAALTLADEGKKLAAENDEEGDGGAGALLAEIKRLTLILVPTDVGWDAVPVDVAINGGHIDAEDWQEALSSLVFFTVSYALARKRDRPEAAKALSSIVGFDMTSSSPEELMASLQTSTKPAATAKKAASSVPV